MDHDTYTIIFQELAKAGAAAEPGHESAEATRAEIDEIAELRRLVAEITEPEPTSYTST